MLLGRPLTMNPESAQDRRTMRRFDMRLLVDSARWELNMSFSPKRKMPVLGACIFTWTARSNRNTVEVTMTFPPHITLTDPVRVRFVARVVRSSLRFRLHALELPH